MASSNAFILRCLVFISCPPGVGAFKLLLDNGTLYSLILPFETGRKNLLYLLRDNRLYEL